jgi:addiction module RelE/StbE family toxin
MIVTSTKRFDKQFKKQPTRIQAEFDKRIRIFLKNYKDPILNTHKLSGNLQGLMSFSVSGDIRVVFEKEDELVTLIAIGSHSQLYS